MEKDILDSMMEDSTWESSRSSRCQEMEYKSIRMGASIQDNSKMERDMEKESLQRLKDK